MTPAPTLDIEELERLEKAATPGPWSTTRAKWPVDGEYDFGISADIGGQPKCIAEMFGRTGEAHRPNAKSTAEFIAALRNAATELFEAARENAERRTRGELVEALNEQAEAQRETIARLREALKAAEESLNEIADRHIGDCPSALGDMDEEEWVRRCYSGLRQTARFTLALIRSALDEPARLVDAARTDKAGDENAGMAGADRGGGA